MFDALSGAPAVERTASGTRVTLRVPVERARAQMTGHYPGFPIFPGVLLVDCVRQAAGLAAGGEVRLVSIDRARFARPLFPGDELGLSLLVTTREDGRLAVRARGVRADGELAADVSLTLALEGAGSGA
ncbi:3-hydroxyacyl-ACP dehydratase FabZ family protein [Streptomyces sp. NPDC056144]|uniref:3-hydroxyacyl-ACP dehydratase FabZ family protein n=1 Tax=unclassified Streptomyces TaxID=2593676 RepID=UPI0035DB577D